MKQLKKHNTVNKMILIISPIANN